MLRTSRGQTKNWLFFSHLANVIFFQCSLRIFEEILILTLIKLLMVVSSSPALLIFIEPTFFAHHVFILFEVIFNFPLVDISFCF